LKKWLSCVNRRICVIGLALSLSGAAVAQTGGQAGTFLGLTSGARAFGLSGTALALTDDASALFVNPGMLGVLADIQLNATLARLNLDRRYYDFAFVYPMNNIGNFALGWTQFGIDNITGRDQNGFITQKFSDLQSAFNLGYGRMIGELFSIGLSVKLLYHNLAGYYATGNAIDIGTAIYLGDHFTIGGVFRNVNSSLKWNTNSQYRETYPTQIGMGLAYYDPLNIRNLLLATDFFLTDNKLSHYSLGAEYLIKDMVAVRGGYANNCIAFGGGILYGPMKLDIAYTPEKFSGGSRINFTLSWFISPGAGAEVSEEEPVIEPVEVPPAQPPAQTQEYRPTPVQKQRVTILSGPLKAEQAEVIRVDENARTITVRLLSLPGSEPITLGLDQVKFIE